MVVVVMRDEAQDLRVCGPGGLAEVVRYVGPSVA